jgi:hypothetical protein
MLIEMTAIEILDTPVKIGLGATITAIGTYFLGKSQHSRELHKARIARRRELVEEIARKTQNVSATLNRCAYSYHLLENQGNENRTKMREVLEPLVDMYTDLNSAEANAALLNESGLKKSIQRLRGTTWEPNKLLLQQRAALDGSAANKLMAQISDYLVEIEDQLPGAYNRVD